MKRLLLLAFFGCNLMDVRCETTVPLVFPKNESAYTILRNETVRENLANDTEVEDLLEPLTTISTAQHIDNLAKNFFSRENFKDFMGKEDAELIQSNVEDTEDANELVHIDRVTIDAVQGHGVRLVEGQMAAVLAGIFVLLAVIGYVGLLSWRRYLENRYGNREMLVNDEEIDGRNDPNDMRHFSL